MKAKLWQPCVIGGLPSVYGIQGSLANLNFEDEECHRQSE